MKKQILLFLVIGLLMITAISSAQEDPKDGGDQKKVKLGDRESKNIDSTNETKLITDFNVIFSTVEYDTIEFTHYRQAFGVTYIYLNIDGEARKWITPTIVFEERTK